MYRPSICLLTIILGTSVLVATADAVETRGKVDAVTVYRGQALVTRLVNLDQPAGLREIIVTDLPEHIVPGSLFAESADGVQVRSVRYRVRPVLKDVREEVRALDEQLRDLNDQLQANQRHTQLVAEQKNYLTKLEQFVAPTANVELTKGVLDADTLSTLTKFIYEQRKTLADEELRLGLEQRDLNEQIQLLQRQKQELTGSSSHTAREAVVFANLTQDGGRLRLRYLVNNASWAPSYNVRTDANRTQVLVEANASIQQMSGEDWSDVEMTLSTATPSLVSKAPTLEPLEITLAAAASKGDISEELARLEQSIQGLKQQQVALSNSRNTITWDASNMSGSGSSAPAGARVGVDLNGDGAFNGFFDLQLGGNAALMANDASLNMVAGQIQNYELVNPDNFSRRGPSTSQPAPSTVLEGLTVTYRLEGRTSLPSRSDRQLIQIAALPMKGEFYKVAIPVLTSFVYEEARITNESDMVLLAGPVTTYVDGQFVGQGDIPTVTIGEPVTVGFGIDSSLRASRELIEKEEEIQGGNRVVDFTYRLAIENFGNQPADVRLFDRLPQTEKTAIKLTLGTNGQSLSEDAEYRETKHKKGILRWDIAVPAQAVGLDAEHFEYDFTLEYDKQMTITGLAKR